MSNFKQTHFVIFSALLLAFGLSTARAGTDDGEKRADAQPVTSETRKQIVGHLLEVVRNADESDEVRASAARSLGTRTSHSDAVRAEVREALLQIVKTKDADPDLQLAAIEALRESDVELTEEHLKEIGEALWNMVTMNEGADESERPLCMMALVEFQQYASDSREIALPPPDKVASIEVLLTIDLADGRFVYLGREVAKDNFVSPVYATLIRSETGLRLLIEAFDELKIESPEEISVGEINRRIRGQVDDDDLLRIRAEVAERQFEEKREILVTLIKQAVPSTEAIAQVLLEAATHENPDIRAAAIKALGNEIPASDEPAK